MPSGAELFIRSIQELGISRIFTLVGDHLNEVLAVAAREGVEILDMRHESGVTHAAEVWGRMHRRPGLALVTGGPGLTNSLTGVAAAYLYSLLATAAPDLFPAEFRQMGRVAVYFEAASVIVSLTLLGQVLELRARSQTSAAIRSLLGLQAKTACRPSVPRCRPAHNRSTVSSGPMEKSPSRTARPKAPSSRQRLPPLPPRQSRAPLTAMPTCPMRCARSQAAFR